MAIGRPKAELVLSAEEHAQLASLAASRALPHAMVARAKLVLWAAARATVRSRCACAGVCPRSASGAGASPNSAWRDCTMN